MTRLLSRNRFWTGVLGVALIAALTLSMSQRVLARDNVGAPAKQSAPTNHTISVTGHGDATTTPDMATITVGVQTRGTDAQSALASNAAKMNAVVAAIEGQGVAADHIQTSSLSLYLDSQSNDYHASHELTVTLDSISLTGPVLDAAVGAGADSSWGVGFGLKDASAQRSQALTAAIADARKKADAMATALGVTVTGVGSASETSYSPPIQYGGVDRTSIPSAPPTQIQPGQLTISADVNVVYTFG